MLRNLFHNLMKFWMTDGKYLRHSGFLVKNSKTIYQTDIFYIFFKAMWLRCSPVIVALNAKIKNKTSCYWLHARKKVFLCKRELSYKYANYACSPSVCEIISYESRVASCYFKGINLRVARYFLRVALAALQVEIKTHSFKK